MMKNVKTDLERGKIVNVIRETTHYEMFKRLEGNRQKKTPEVKSIMNSMDIIGYYDGLPIAVNKNGEIIDGQHRLDAAMALGIPVKYVVTDGDIDTCMLLNNKKNSSSWTTMDRILAYNEMGNENYTYLLAEYDRYKGLLPKNIISLICYNSNSVYTWSGVMDEKAFHFGDFVFPIEEIEEIEKKLDTLVSFNDIFKLINNGKSGRADYFFYTINFVLSQTDIDAKKLYTKMMNRISTFSPINDTTYFLKQLSNAYNYSSQKKYHFDIMWEDRKRGA